MLSLLIFIAMVKLGVTVVSVHQVKGFLCSKVRKATSDLPKSKRY